MCVIPVAFNDGASQLYMMFLVFGPVLFGTLCSWPWRETVANMNDFVLSSAFMTIIMLSCLLVEDPSAGVRNTIGSFIVIIFIFALVVVALICADMVAILLLGRAVFMKSPTPSESTMQSIAATMMKLSAMGEMGAEVTKDEVNMFVKQLPPVDVGRFVWVLSLMESGLFGLDKTTKRINGISPIRPRKGDDERTQSIRKTISRISQIEGEPSEAVVPVAEKPEADETSANEPPASDGSTAKDGVYLSKDNILPFQPQANTDVKKEETI